MKAFRIVLTTLVLAITAALYILFSAPGEPSTAEPSTDQQTAPNYSGLGK